MSMIDRCKFLHNLPCEQVSDRIAELEEENAKLRQECDHWHVEQVHAYGNWEDAHKRSSELESENAKLRELLADTIIDPRDYCAKYGIDYDGWNSANDDIDRRMRELGIEVK